MNTEILKNVSKALSATGSLALATSYLIDFIIKIKK